jgi:CheY-like chemotaxis protein
MKTSQSKTATNKVLIVENTQNWREILESTLNEVGIACESTANYTGAINALKSGMPLALILDLELNEGNPNENEWDGWLLAKEAKKQNIASVIVTGHNRDSVADRIIVEANAVGFFDKARFADRKSIFLERVQAAMAITKTAQKNGKVSRSSRPGHRSTSAAKSTGKNTKRQKGVPANSNVFISYSHNDLRWLKKFTTNLGVLERRNLITVWTDTQIRPGAKWKTEIKEALTAAKIALLLVTPEFLASDFIRNKELPSIFRSARKKGLVIFWVAVKPSLWKDTYISEFQAASDPDKPLSVLKAARRDEEIVKICERLRDAANL